MNEIELTSAARGSLPTGYTEALYWRVTNNFGRMVVMQILSLPLFGLAFGGFFWIAGRMHGTVGVLTINSGGTFLVTLLALLLEVVLHELVHGLSMQLFGAHPQYGVMWKQLMFYATSPGYAFPRRQYMVMALAPLVVLSVLAVPLMALVAGTDWIWLVIVCAALNAAGAIGDLWIVALVLRYPANAYVMDEKDGVRIFLAAKGL